MIKSTLLVIGDLTMDGIKPAPSVNKFIENSKRLIDRKIEFKFVN